MPGPRSRDLTVVATVLAFVAVITIAGALLAPETSDDLPQGSSFSRAPSGTAAAYLTLRSIGYTVERSFDPLSSMTAAPLSTVLIVADPKEPPSNQDRRAAQAFVAAGGTLLVTGCAGASFLSSTAAGLVMSSAPPRTYTAGFPSPLSAGAASISMTSRCSPPQLGPGYVPLYADGADAVVWFSRVGRGLAVWCAGSTPFENSSIEQEGHLALLLNIAGLRDRRILWNEFYHGQRRSLWSYAVATPLPWVLAQVALVAVVAAATFGRRRLPIRARFTEARTSPLEFVETMAALYARAPSAAAAVALARTRLRRKLLELTGLQPDAADARLAAAASPRLRIPSDELREVLEAAARAGSDSSTTPETALPLVRRLQDVAGTLHGG